MKRTEGEGEGGYREQSKSARWDVNKLCASSVAQSKQPETVAEDRWRDGGRRGEGGGVGVGVVAMSVRGGESGVDKETDTARLSGE